MRKQTAVMQTIEKSIEVNSPVATVYNQWTQFEEFPRFMEGIEEVRQMGDRRLHWKASIGGKQKEWDAEIIEQIPDERISWKTTTGAKNSGTVNFFPVDGNTTRISLALSYQPESALEKMGDALGLFSGQVEGDLKRFKDFIEARGHETGGWRGEIRGNSTSSEMGRSELDRIQSEPRSKRLHDEPPKL